MSKSIQHTQKHPLSFASLLANMPSFRTDEDAKFLTEQLRDLADYIERGMRWDATMGGRMPEPRA